MKDTFKYDNGSFAVDDFDDEGSLLELQEVTLSRAELVDLAGEEFTAQLESRAREQWRSEAGDRAIAELEYLT